jgi:hypothetical protein
MKNGGLIWLLLVAPAVYADGLADLRASLARMGAREPVRVAVSLETHSRGGEDEKPDSGKATFEVEHGADGLRLIYAPDVVTRAQQEARANGADPEKPTPTRTAMRQVDPADLIELLDAAASLTRRLDRATLVKDQRITVGGKPVRQLTLSLRPSLSKADAKRVKSFELTLIVNIDGDGIPLSAELRQSMKAKFLLISFEQNQQEIWVFGRTGDRLMAVRHHHKATGSGMGQKFESNKLMTLAVR